VTYTPPPNMQPQPAGASSRTAAARKPRKQGFLGRFSKSIKVQLVVLLLIFSIPPILLYSVFGTAEDDKQHLLLEAVRENGRTVARALTPFVQAMQPGDLSRIPAELERFGSDQRSIKVLFKPNGVNAGFYYVASAPTIAAEALSAERERLVELGIIAQLEQSCTGDIALGNRILQPSEQRDVLLSITPVQSPRGCWVIIVAASEQSVAGIMSGQPYWMRPETRMAAIVYISMAVMVFVLFTTVWLGLSRFKRAALNVERGTSFASSTAVPELMQMGRVLDAMVGRLQQTTDMLRTAAEDNAHAFKGPIAVIRQAMERVSRRLAGSSDTSLAAINASLDRLEGLVRSAQHLDAATADILEAKWSELNVSDLVTAFIREYQYALEVRNVILVSDIAPGIVINGRREMLETVLENLMDNALSFSPKGGRVTVSLAGDSEAVALCIMDEGPGVSAHKLPRIFDRYYSSRPQTAELTNPSEAHFGIGLWLVRQNVQAMGGTVQAENLPPRDPSATSATPGGFAVTVNIPLSPTA
jgi:two-component system sensor histidine kinase ChvG